MLVNNNFTNTEVDMEVKRALETHFRGKAKTTDKTTLKLYYRNQMTPAYREDESAIRTIIRRNVTPTDPDTKLQLVIYYRNTKSRQLAMKNNEVKTSTLKATNVVYAFKCTHGDCKLRPNARYIGQTTTTLSRRLTMHLQSGAIANHMRDAHDRNLTRQELTENTEILAHEHGRKRLIILEACYIRALTPSLNTQQDIQGVCTLYDSGLMHL